jgi:copper(I)-binding protein
MRHPIVVVIVSVTALVVAGLANAATIEARGAWIRTPPSGAATAAGYVTLINHGASADRLTGGRTSVAASLEAHQMSMAGGVMRMRPIVGGLPIGAGAAVELSPSGTHLMLIGLKRPLKSGEHVKATLDFARAGAVVVDFVVSASGPVAAIPKMRM